MKRLFIAFLLLSLVSAQTLFASDDKVSAIVTAAFQRSYQNAQNVAWTKMDNLYKVSFTVNKQCYSAFYTGEGQMLAVTRYTKATQLPMALQTSLKKFADHYRVTEIFEVDNNHTTQFYVTLEDEKKIVVMQSESNHNWAFFKKEKK